VSVSIDNDGRRHHIGTNPPNARGSKVVAGRVPPFMIPSGSVTMGIAVQERFPNALLHEKYRKSPSAFGRR
jgi:hypothetical protein